MPPPSRVTRVIAWSIPAAIVALIVATFCGHGHRGRPGHLLGALERFPWCGGSPDRAGPSPLLLIAFVVAPISSLSPLLATGWLPGWRKPCCGNRRWAILDLADDIHSLKGFWRNRCRILLVVACVQPGQHRRHHYRGAEIVNRLLALF